MSSKPTQIWRGKQFYGCCLMERKAECESSNQKNFESAAEYILVLLQLLNMDPSNSFRCFGIASVCFATSK